jgi:hypothetical protein
MPTLPGQTHSKVKEEKLQRNSGGWIKFEESIVLAQRGMFPTNLIGTVSETMGLKADVEMK